LQDITQQVKQESAQMLEGSRQVIAESKNLTLATGKVSQSVSSITSSASHIEEAIEEVSHVSVKNREHIDALLKEVARFDVNSVVSYEWDKTFAVGHPEVDEQHRTLFQALNKFIEACADRDVKTFNECISFLGNYVVKHFADEEAVQIACKYPDYANHKKIHEDYTAAVVQLAGKWLKSGPSNAVLQEIRVNVGGWLINHIKGQDIKIGTYL
jgi:hemerythrin